jgi:hypothetical protein
LIGAIWGHYVWDVPLSMFSIVGLIGMSGIIINDSIVLVSTIDEYSKKRGLFPAIVDGVADRLRPVLLTTLTTVLGLAPLLYESSSQASFLKPTVITLVYGLAFGMVLVLLVVPALMAVQADVGRMLRSLRRGASEARMRLPLGVAAAGMAGLFALFMGPVVTGGAMAPLLPGLSATPMALGAFVLASGLVAIVVFGIARWRVPRA